MESIPQRPKIVFMGTPDFAVPPLESLLEAGFPVVGVVTQPDRPKGRGKKVGFSPVKGVALDRGVRVFQPQKSSDPEFLQGVRERAPDLLIVVAYGQILRKELLEIPRFGALNIHASLLPKYRGAAPIQWAIYNREEKTGLTAMWMEEGLDSGPIILQEEVPISPEMTAGQLHDKLSRLSGPFLVRVLEALAAGRAPSREQDHDRATYAPKIGRHMSVVDWEVDAQSISSLIRALDPWPGASTTFEGQEIKLFSSRVLPEMEPSLGHPGKVTGMEGDSLRVETGRGILLVRELQLPGKKRLPASDFLRGFRIAWGALLGT
jgi:methionyl-tRNA formyltransferase